MEIIKTFIELYIAAFLSQDATYLSNVYSYPVTFYSESGDAIVMDEKQFSNNTIKLFNIYNTLGVVRIDYDVIDETTLSENLVLVSIKWSFQDNDSTEIYHCTTRYLYRLDHNDIKIAAVFVVDETSKLNRLLDR